jgi:hypothetical protein
MVYLGIAFKHKVEDLRMALFGEEQEKNVACDSCVFFQAATAETSKRQ